MVSGGFADVDTLESMIMPDSLKQPLVSVVIPTWNRPDTLRRALESVCRQSWPAWEIVVADEGGHEATPSIVREFTDSRIRYYRHDARLGFLGNWTFGIRHARGEWLAILGDDDYYRPDFLANRMEIIRQHPSVVAVTGTFVCCDAQGNELWRSRAFTAGEGVVSGADLRAVTMSRTGDWFNGATLYQRSLVDALWEKIAPAGSALDLALNAYLATAPDASLGLVQRWDMVLTRHPGQESIVHQFQLGRGGAIFALVMALADADRVARQPGLRRWLAVKVNEHARQNWDVGNLSSARTLRQP